MYTRTERGKGLRGGSGINIWSIQHKSATRVHVICLYDIHECVYVCEGVCRDDCEKTLYCAIYRYTYTFIYNPYIYIARFHQRHQGTVSFKMDVDRRWVVFFSPKRVVGWRPPGSTWQNKLCITIIWWSTICIVISYDKTCI